MKTITPQSSADQRQKLLKLYQRHHRSPPGSTLELAQWLASDEGRAALQAEAKVEQKADEAKADVTEKRRHKRTTGERTAGE